MNELPPSAGPPEDLDELYRRAAALDPSRPSAAVRRAVLAHAAQRATEHARSEIQELRGARAALKPLWWQPALFGTLAAAALAALIIAPAFLLPRAPRVPATAPVTNSPSPAASPAVAQTAEGRAQGLTPSAPPSAGATRRDAPRAGLAQVTPSTPRVPAAPSAGAAATESTAGRLANGALRQSTVPDQRASAFRHAAEIGDLQTLQELRPGTAIDARDTSGRTALMLATLHGQSQAVAALLAYGADPNVVDAHGTTPLQAAQRTHEPVIVAALRRYGAQ